MPRKLTVEHGRLRKELLPEIREATGSGESNVMSTISPLTGRDGVRVVREIDCNWMIEEYRRLFGIDVARYFHGRKTIQQLECLETGYGFYGPPDISGDGAFYEQLEGNRWYYLDWKWEHDRALLAIEDRDNVLEVGCARGSFLDRVRDRGCDCTGLELNARAAETARGRGLRVLQESIQQHACAHPQTYDVVCMFQVLEHVAEVKEVLEAAIRLLKPEGRLIIGVPDNSERAYTSLFVRADNILNMPPHHMGLWSNVSLAALQTLLPVRLRCAMVEPAVASHHKNSYRGLIRRNLMDKYGVLGKGYYYLIRGVLMRVMDDLCEYLPAHSIFACFERV